jgi:predicted enzyme related to lactoylglutathione lyase
MMKMSQSVNTPVSILEHIGCLYLPADDVRKVYDWYEKHFSQEGHTRHYKFFYGEPVSNINYFTDEWLEGQRYEMFSVRFETDCIEELYEHLLRSGEVRLEPLQHFNYDPAFCFYDPQGNKFQVWQNPKTKPQPLRDGIRPLIGVSAFFFPASDPEAAKKWYTDVLGVKIGESGQPVTESGVEFYFIRPLELYPSDEGGLPELRLF